MLWVAVVDVTEEAPPPTPLLPARLQQNLPFLCPLDHVMDPTHFDDAAAELVLPFRESTHLTNLRAALAGGRQRRVRRGGLGAALPAGSRARG